MSSTLFNQVAAPVLTRAADRLQQGWCQHHHAEDPYGTPCDPDDPEAVGWCASGALLEAFAALYGCSPHHLGGEVYNDPLDDPADRDQRAYYHAYHDLERLLIRTLQDHHPDGAPPSDLSDLDLITFNDAGGQTQDHVVTLFQRALHRLPTQYR